MGRFERVRYLLWKQHFNNIGVALITVAVVSLEMVVLSMLHTNKDNLSDELKTGLELIIGLSGAAFIGIFLLLIGMFTSKKDKDEIIESSKKDDELTRKEIHKLGDKIVSRLSSRFDETNGKISENNCMLAKLYKLLDERLPHANGGSGNSNGNTNDSCSTDDVGDDAGSGINDTNGDSDGST